MAGGGGCKLIDEGNTIPFIARYRKEATGNLNDETLRAFDERLHYLNNLWDRKESVLGSIEEQGKLTDELREQVLSAATLVELEDLYRPYKQKRRTRASIARERGLEPLAELILLQQTQLPLTQEAEAFVNPERMCPTYRRPSPGHRTSSRNRYPTTRTTANGSATGRGRRNPDHRGQECGDFQPLRDVL